MTIRTRDPSTQVRVKADNLEPSMTIQSAEAECNINNIMRRYTQGGVVPQRPGGQYLDVSFAIEYHEAMGFVLNAQQAFDNLPAVVRREFDNDPNRMLDFVSYETNRSRAIELGLIDPEPDLVPNFTPTPVETPDGAS